MFAPTPSPGRGWGVAHSYVTEGGSDLRYNTGSLLRCKTHEVIDTFFGSTEEYEKHVQQSSVVIGA